MPNLIQIHWHNNATQASYSLTYGASLAADHPSWDELETYCKKLEAEGHYVEVELCPIKIDPYD